MAEQVESSSHIEVEENYFVFNKVTQLHQIQKNILLHQESGSVIEDDSIEIHIASTPYQEILHLREYLYQLLCKGGIEPKEIVVMAPHISHYAPFIEAIFATTVTIKLPISPPTKDNRPFVALFLALDLEKKKWSGSALLELLSHPLLQRKQKFTEADLEQFRNWVEATGITWGFDASHRAAFLKKHHSRREKNDPTGTWMWGLGHLVEELALLPPDPARHPRISFSQAELLGDLMTWLKSLYHFTRQWEEPKTLNEWSESLRKFAHDFMIDSEECDLLWHISETIGKAGRHVEKRRYSFRIHLFSLTRRGQSDQSHYQ